ncbi:hypothetical protein BATDEDRAFT_27249 [Batrachochytrium dendrobatidis JAM81]|uniref:Uncharacterized protein n=1 Tax=Batrachochytrium dendrobatidis (strain JAM81 / FGSC 10211) TaxID=684364 RepID=F4PAC7_BATDJ|nr:uncharacterized protein BATDEDRAFT_27249 [Batrachochytrium dendrobatidis JAM81]XP_006683354.1 uncharacterized protein BATDEDRAFT_93113 [Batrachochytrium dendrobatidis JAM81]EGF76025.1 hypothetical protein BATDEDRAFT_93113 [Batrachochytrium dendrobatidis JAM81]EGF78046.1 hypothetical protein BATDEDRAFT_27249 [Batrachochytrium dendrobatidis JAM81]|eukprot:XP_006681419.1 hypothetical protein BATDEDRAFT_27249 [Batrachochytrium dendrobatidis JAM81]
MKLPTAVLSSILLICSVTIAKPILPTETTDTVYNPSATPNPNSIDLGSLDSLSADMKNLLKEYSKVHNDYNRKKKECELIDLEHSNLRSTKSHLEKKISNLKRKMLTNKFKLKSNNGNDRMKELEQKLEKEESDFAFLQRKKNRCKFELSRFDYDLELIIISLVEFVFKEPFTAQTLDGQLLRILSHPIVKQYLGELCEQSSACSGGSGQSSNFEQQRQDPQPSPQTQSGFRSFGQRLSSGIRSGFSKFGDRFKSLIDQFRSEN